MATKNLLSQLPVLKVLKLKACDKQTRAALLRDQRVLIALKEICFNILRGNLSIPRKLKTEIQKHQKALLKIVEQKRGTKVVHQTFLNQRGGSLLLAILSVAIPILEKLLNR